MAVGSGERRVRIAWGHDVPLGVGALERGDETRVGFEHEFLAARRTLGCQRGIEELVAHSLLAPYGEAARAPPVGGAERRNRKCARHRDRRPGVVAQLVQLPTRLELELA